MKKFISCGKFNKYYYYINQRPSNASNKTQDTNSKQIILIHNDSEDFNHKNKYFIICLIIIVLWILEELLIDIYSYALKDLDFWMVELVIITKINSLMFNLKIYAHQKFALWSIILPCLLKIVTIILSYFDDNDEEIPILYNINKIYIPIGIVIYIALITLRSYVNAKIKWFMDLKYISHSNLLFYYGILGTIICSIIASVSTFTKCKHNPNKLDISDYICKSP